MVGRAARRGNREIFRDFEVEGFVLSERDQCRDALQELIPETRDDVSGASRSGRYGRFRLSLVHGESCQVPPRMSLAIAGQHAKCFREGKFSHVLAVNLAETCAHTALPNAAQSMRPGPRRFSISLLPVQASFAS